MAKKPNIKWVSVIKEIEKVFSLLPPTIFIMLVNPIISFPLVYQEESRKEEK